MANGNLVSQPLDQVRDLNWVLLVELLVCGILTIFFFGYFDRLFATLVSYGIRAYTWRNFRAYIDIQALQISLLGGRIFFKEIRYHAHNETIIVHSGYITWKYWFRKVRDAEIFSDPPGIKRQDSSSPSSRSRTPSPDRTESGGVKKRKAALPCRINVKLEGVQAFLYNRSPVYDAIVDRFAQATDDKHNGSVHATMGIGKTTSSESLSSGDGVFAHIENHLEPLRSSEKTEAASSPADEREKQMAHKNVAPRSPKIPSFLRLFPIRVQCKIAAAVLGNDNTRAIVTVRLDEADGTFDAGHAGPLDIYKLMFNFEFENTVIKMKPNHDFKEPQLAMAAGLKNGAEEEDLRKPKNKQHEPKPATHQRHVLSRLFGAPTSSESVRAASAGYEAKVNHHLHAPNAIPGQERWQGLTRYLDDDVTNEHDEWDPIEYALYSTIAEVPKIGMLFYWDIPALVPVVHESPDSNEREFEGDINGSSPPEYGMDLHIHGGTIHYGPWADRQRIQFQNIFFPQTYSDAIPANKLAPGEERVSTVFKLYLSVEEDTTLRMPVREPSKDWRWKGKAGSFAGQTQTKTQGQKGKSKGKRVPFWRSKDKGAAGPNMRPFAWLDLTIKSNSTVNYAMDMVARPSGYRSKVRVEVSGLEIQTSVNHGLLWRSGCTRLDADTSVPLGWNAFREWKFNIMNDDLELFILRDHLFLITDIIADWSSGPLPEYFTFTPYKYLLDIGFRNFKMYLNTNTSNIIDEPADFDKNQFVILYGRDLHADVIIPLDKFRPERSEVFFDVLAKDLGLQLCLSPGNTVAAFLDLKNVAELDSLSLKGSHAAFAEISTNLTDRLTFNIHGEGLDLYLFGYVVDRLVTLKENYFGDDLHFRTLEEFQDMTRGKDSAAESDAKAQQSNRSNDLDVILIISAERVRGYLPSNLYDGNKSIAIDCPYASADLRINNYFMDLQVDFSPLSVSHTILAGGQAQPMRTVSKTEVFIASASLVGHRAFGLPPKEPDYLCIWNVDVGAISGECSDEFVSLLAHAAGCFASTLNDNENATALVEPAVIHDTQFLKLRTHDVKLWLHVGSDALMVSTGPVIVDLNDWAQIPFSKRIKVLVPDLTIALVDAQSGSRHRLPTGEDRPVKTHAYLRTTVSLAVLERKLHFSEELQKQQEHLVESDSRTYRTPFLVHMNRSTSTQSLLRTHQEPPASIYPPIPEPLQHGARSSSELTSRPPSPPQMGSRASSMASSRRLLRSSSQLSKRSAQASLAASLRRIARPKQPGRFFSAVQNLDSKSESEADNIVLPDDRERPRRSLPPSSITFSSSLATPYFPLQTAEPDASDLPTVSVVPKLRHGSSLPEFNDVANRDLDEEIGHTSLIICADSGVQCVLKPEAVSSFTSLLDLLLPKTPDELLDLLQLQVMSQLLGVEKRKKGTGDALEVAVRVPFIAIRFLNAFESSEISPPRGVDQYDLEVKRLILTLRDTKQPVARRGEVDDSVLVHCAAESISLSVNERARNHEVEKLRFCARVDDLLFWLTVASKNSVHVSFRSFAVETASRQIELLAAVIHRTFILVNESVSKFSTILQSYSERQRYLAYSLTMAGSGVADPPFLNRTGIALRIAPHHLRNHDSWKIISRLRYIWQNMSDQEKQNVEYACKQGGALYPANAQAVVTKNWDEWRTWDLAHVKKSHIMRILYGATLENEPELMTKETVATELQIRSGTVRVTIDPGPLETQLAIQALTINLDLSPPLAPSGLMLVSSPVDYPIEDIVLQANAKSIMLRINWDIVNLVELAVKFAQQDLSHLMPAKVKAPTPDEVASRLKSVWRSFQIVVCVGNIGLAIDSNNLNALAASKQFRLSLVGTDKSSSHNGQYITALLHASQSYIELRSHQRHLAHLGADAPNLLISRDFKGISSNIPEDLRFAGTTSNLVIETREELLGLIETVDMIIRDEVATAIRKFAPLMPKLPPPESKSSATIPATLPKITIALIMDAYRVDVAMLPSLTFSMDGKLGRISVSPTFEEKVSLDINLDLGERLHSLISRDSTGTHVISLLNIPPINGKVKVKRTKDRLDLAVSMTMETIVFEAHAVHGLVSILSQEEVLSTFKALAADVQTLKQNIDRIVPQPTSPQTPVVSTPPDEKITYSVAVTLAGVQIKADAPGKLKDSGTANLLVGLNCLHLIFFNVTADNDEILPLPEIHAQMREFVIDLLITDSRGTRRSGNLSLAASAHCTLRKSRKGQIKRNYRAQVNSITINAIAETASAVVDVLNHLQDRLKDVDLSKEKNYLQRLRQPSRRPSSHLKESMYSDLSMTSSGLLDSYISVSLNDIQIAWIVGGSVSAFPKYNPEDLVLSIRLIDLSTKSENSSSLKIQDLQIQMVPPGEDRIKRSLNSALMPQVIFNVGYASTDEEWKLAFQATGESLDVVLDSKFMLPANMLHRSIELAIDKFKDVSSSWQMTPTATGAQRKKIFGDKRLSSLLADADFAGAVLRLKGRGRSQRAAFAASRIGSDEEKHGGRYGQFLGDDNAAGAQIETPGLAVKVQYKDSGIDSSLNAEVKISGSSNTLVPTVVPLILEISDSIKTIVAKNEETQHHRPTTPSASTTLIDGGLLTTDPSDLLGSTSINLGIRICRQEFSLSCQPIARVAASAHVDDIYITANNVKSTDHGHFIAVSAQFENLQASIQHIYSRESTFNFAIQLITLSIMNSKHLSGKAGVCAVLKVYPMRTQINARQLQDFLLFREIWLPPEIRTSSVSPHAAPTVDSQDYFVARYHQVTNTAAFPWTATVQIAEMKVEIDMGQSIGKATLSIDDLWASSRKNSNWEQNLVIGIGKVGIDCTGRTSGFVDLLNFKVRTMIAWPQHEEGHRQTPFIQAAVGFERLRVKAAFDYQAFGIADISSFDFLMYNVRPEDPKEKDRLVAMLEGDRVHVFCTATTAAQSVALFQAVEKLKQDTETAYANSLKDIERFLRRQSTIVPTRLGPPVSPESPLSPKKDKDEAFDAPISLYTDVVVTIRSIQIGAFPSAFFDSQIFLIEASDVQARFAATIDKGKIRTGLGMTLGQLQVALTAVQHPTGPKTLQEITVDDVVKTAVQSRGGTILRVPKVIATMETWQSPGKMAIEYIFKSMFEGKVDVGWNVGRISFIRSMYNTHARNLASRLGKPLPESAVKITTERPLSIAGEVEGDMNEEPEKITAVVNVPQSKYMYIPLEPPIIETPQLRDMGEATPPLEWIGLHRDRLPNVTHQIIIVGLMGVAREVGDAYGRILGNS